MKFARPVCHKCGKKTDHKDNPLRQDRWCRNCRREYTKRRRREGKDQWLLRRQNPANRLAIKKLLAGRADKCVRCGWKPKNDLEWQVMEFHHDTKKFNLTGTMESLALESVKCELLCANCHRIATLDPAIART